MQFANDIGPVTSSSDAAQPSVGELGEPRPGDGLYSAPIDDMWDEVPAKTTRATVVEQPMSKSKDGGDMGRVGRPLVDGQQIERYKYCPRSADRSQGS
jgi:hypothetical protein